MAYETTLSYNESIYTLVHSALRSTLSQIKIEEVLKKRNEIGPELARKCAEKASEIGLEIVGIEIRDVMFPTELKKIFNEVVRAQKESQAGLERTRGETAALRSLANAAKLIEDHPALLQLRTLQTVGSAVSGSKSALVMDMADFLNCPKPKGKKVAHE
jgi:regulator of protease activity HflC (stomatin/prohibitin superfamily)